MHNFHLQSIGDLIYKAFILLSAVKGFLSTALGFLQFKTKYNLVLFITKNVLSLFIIIREYIINISFLSKNTLQMVLRIFLDRITFKMSFKTH